MKRKLVGGTLMALVIMGSLALATARDQQPAAEDNAQQNGHAKVWAKIDTAPAQETPTVHEEHPAAAAKAEVTEKTGAEAAAAHQVQQETPNSEELQKKLADAETTIQALQKKLDADTQSSQAVESLQEKLNTAESTIQDLQEKLAAAQQDAARNAEDLQTKLTEAEAAVQQLEAQAEESTRTIEDLNKQLATFQALTEQPLTVTECDALRAQVTGLELMAQEQLKTIEQHAEEKNYWQINKDLLLSKIKELQNSVKKLEEYNRGLQRDLTTARK